MTGGRLSLLFLPGLLCDAAVWAPQQAALADLADIDIVDLTGRDSIDGMVATVLDRAPPRFALAGFSMGGYVAFGIMRTAPERVERLALVDTSARPDTAEVRQRREDLVALAGRGQFQGVTARLLPLFLHPDRLADETLAGAVTAMTLRVGREAFLRQQTAILGRPDSRPGLGAIRAPTLVICGRQDVLTPPAASTEIAANIDDATLRMLEDCGHMSTLERPDEVSGHLRQWLAR